MNALPLQKIQTKSPPQYVLIINNTSELYALVELTLNVMCKIYSSSHM